MLNKALSLAVLIAALGLSGQANSQDQTQKNVPPTSSGDASFTAGRAVFNSAGGCLTCHRVGAKGSVTGPNLSNVGARLTQDAIRRRLTEPSATIDPKNRLAELVLADGKSAQGKLVNQDPFSVQLLNVSGELVAYQRAQIRDIRVVDPPKMPPFKSVLTDDQINNLVAYLATLRTPGD